MIFWLFLVNVFISGVDWFRVVSIWLWFVEGSVSVIFVILVWWYLCRVVGLLVDEYI